VPVIIRANGDYAGLRSGLGISLRHVWVVLSVGFWGTTPMINNATISSQESAAELLD